MVQVLSCAREPMADVVFHTGGLPLHTLCRTVSVTSTYHAGRCPNTPVYLTVAKADDNDPSICLPPVDQQVALCLRRGFWRLKADPSLTVTQILGNSIMGLIISSVFYNLQPTSGSFFQRGALLFFAILINAFGSALEVRRRKVVPKYQLSLSRLTWFFDLPSARS